MTRMPTPLERIYKTDDADAQRTAYDDWAQRYEADLAAGGYATPHRLAKMVARFAHVPGPVLDFGCGTGLAGAALAAEGLGPIDGVDMSEGMMARARERGLYRSLILSDPAAPHRPSGYPITVACGAISPGAAPASLLAPLAGSVPDGGLLVFSFNDLALKEETYRAALDGLDAMLTPLCAEHGPHLPAHGLMSTIYAYRK
ncbi:MAG: methyltransferase type 11 [Rhodobacterales bacterium]|nr:MAG: methyltransferase type 11 [Rhodobacterales bacterium]